MAVQSQLLNEIPNILHGFGTAQEPVPSNLKHALERNGPLTKQVHGVRTCRVEKLKEDCGETDALYTDRPLIPVGIRTADCVPILLAQKDGRKIGAIHSGWRGTYQRILEHQWDVLRQEGEILEDWVVAIGPAIGPCCYQVSSELCHDFKVQFSEVEPSIISPQEDHLDLKALIKRNAEMIGFRKIDLLDYCTRCSKDPAFFSYRRGDLKDRQWSGLMIQS